MVASAFVRRLLPVPAAVLAAVLPAVPLTAQAQVKSLCVSGQDRVFVDKNRDGVFDGADAYFRLRMDGDVVVLSAGNGVQPNPDSTSCRGCAYLFRLISSAADRVELQEISSQGTFEDYNNPVERLRVVITKAGGARNLNRLELLAADPGNSDGTLTRSARRTLAVPAGLYDSVVGTATNRVAFNVPLTYSEVAQRLYLVFPVRLFTDPPGLASFPVAVPIQDQSIVFQEATGFGSGFSCGRELFRIPLNPDLGAAPPAQVVPIVLDVTSGSARFTTELSLANPSGAPATVGLAYTASLGSREGSGSVSESVAAGAQVVIRDVIAYLRGKGLAIPESGAQGGALAVTTTSGGPAGGVVATARTATDTQAPNPVGRAGLAYGAVPAAEAITSSATVYGLRSTTADRSNLAVFNMGPEPVSVKVTAFSGTGDGRQVEVFTSASPLTLPAYGWYQENEILGRNGIESGYVTIERVSSTGAFSAYGIVNDNPTSDGSYVPPVVAGATGSRLTLPVLVETAAFRSEMVLANRGTATATFALRYVESLSPSSGAGGTVNVSVPAGRQLILADAVDYLRRNGAAIGAMGSGSYAGAVRASVSGVPLSSVFIGARTASQAPGGGQFGLFTPGLYEGQESTAGAAVYGLQADALNRTNVAVLNAGEEAQGSVTLRLQVHDGADGAAKGSPLDVTLGPGQWAQPGGFFAGAGVSNGYVKVTRTSGTAPWIAYGVVNDGGNPSERTGDGAYVAAVAGSASASPADVAGAIGRDSGRHELSFVDEARSLTASGLLTAGLLLSIAAGATWRLRRRELASAPVRGGPPHPPSAHAVRLICQLPPPGRDTRA